MAQVSRLLRGADVADVMARVGCGCQIATMSRDRPPSERVGVERLGRFRGASSLHALIPLGVLRIVNGPKPGT